MRINHILIRASNLEAMTDFWVDVIGLEIGYRPPFPFIGNWLYSEDKPLVHIAAADSVTNGGAAIDHVALEGSNYQELIGKLQHHGIHFFERDVPESGERQVFISAPDGLKVEMLFPAGTGGNNKQPY